MSAESIPLFAAVLAGLAVMTLCLGILRLHREDALRRRLVEKAVGRSPAEVSGEGGGGGMSDFFGRLGSRLGPKDEQELTRQRLALIRAGIESPAAPLVFHGAKAALAALLGGAGLALRVFAPDDVSMGGAAFTAVFAASAGAYLPDLWLRRRVAARQLRLMNELPDALDLLVVCVESGMGLDQAIHRVSEELAKAGPTICAELRRMTLELRAGKARREALKNLALRTGLEDVNSLVTLLIQADVFGISVARTLRVYSDTLRAKRFSRAEESAAKLPAKLLFPLVVCILPALFIAIMGPAALQLMDVFAKIQR